MICIYFYEYFDIYFCKEMLYCVSLIVSVMVDSIVGIVFN